MMVAVSSTFPTVPKGKRGYDVDEVDSFLADARKAYAGDASIGIDSARIRRTAFGLTKSGYSTAHVDAALERLEDAFAGHRFDRVGILTTGYHPRDVDRLTRRLHGYFTDGRPLSIDDVRSSVFRPRRGGYRESQVDLLLDTVVDVMLAVR